MDKSTIFPALIFGTIFLLILYLLWLMFQPILSALIFAGILGGSFYPLYLKIKTRLKISPNLAALIMCSIIILVIFIPSIFLIFQLSNETIDVYHTIRQEVTDDKITNYFSDKGYVGKMLKKMDVEINIVTIKQQMYEGIKEFSGFLLDTFNAWMGNILSFLFDFVIMILMIFMLFTEGDKLKKFMLALSPLPDEQEELIIVKFNQMNYVTLVCNGIGGLIQGVLSGIAFLFVGINSVFLWTTFMVVLAFIPLLGISIIYIPACIYLAIKGRIIAAIFLFVYCTSVSLIVENWFKPKFIGKRIQINSLFVLLCIIGGMGAFGMAGIFYGPIVGIMFLTLVELYHEYYYP